MDAPRGFRKRLQEHFGDRLRIRWSDREHEWLIEEKVGRAVLPPIRIEEGRDDLIRARDGYALVLAIRPGDRMPCYRCRTDLKVPVFKAAEVICPTCSARANRRVALKAAYWPLGESLLEYLRKIDPLTGGHQRLMAEMDRSNQALEAGRARDDQNYGEAVWRDHFTQVMQIPSVGYTGKEQYQD